MAVPGVTTFSGDGKAVNVPLTSTVKKGDVIYVNQWLGIAGSAGDSDDTIALIADFREYVFDVGALAVNMGDTVWVTVNLLTGHQPTLAGYFTSAGSNRIRLFRASEAKDTNNFVRGVLISGLGLL